MIGTCPHGIAWDQSCTLCYRNAADFTRQYQSPPYPPAWTPEKVDRLLRLLESIELAVRMRLPR